MKRKLFINECMCLACPYHSINKDLEMWCGWMGCLVTEVINCAARRDLGHDYSLYRDIDIIIQNHQN